MHLWYVLVIAGDSIAVCAAAGPEIFVEEALKVPILLVQLLIFIIQPHVINVQLLLLLFLTFPRLQCRAPVLHLLLQLLLITRLNRPAKWYHEDGAILLLLDNGRILKYSNLI